MFNSQFRHEVDRQPKCLDNELEMMVDLFVNQSIDKPPEGLQLDWSINTNGGDMFKSMHSCSLIQSSFHD